MQEVDVDLLRNVDACLRSVTKPPSKTKHSSAGLELFAARTFQEGQATGSYYGTLIHHDLTSRKHTRKMYENGVLKVDVTRFS